MATKGGQLDIMEVLVDGGAVLNVKDKNGHTPLPLVALDGSERTAVWLRRHSADLRARNDVGQTPLDLAKSRLAKNEVGFE
jgi:ankyrin repeat protein